MTQAPIVEEISLAWDPLWSAAFVAACALGLLAVLVAFPPDRSRLSPAGRAILTALRFAAFLAVVTCMLRPAIVATSKARQEGTVVVLVDGSRSMTVTDGAAGRSRWDEMVLALDAARPAARRLTGSGGFELAVRRFDRDSRAVAAAGDDPFPFAAWQDGLTADETAIGAAIEDALEAAAGRELAALIVLSDGGHHAYAPRDAAPQSAARRAADAAVPLWSITFGRPLGEGEGRDAAVTSLAVEQTGYVGNLLEVAARIRLEGLAGREVVVSLLAEDDSGTMGEVARTVLRPGVEMVEEAVRLDWTPATTGERKLTLRVEPQDGEAVLANNELSTFVAVIDGGLKVLYLEGVLRVEQRFLRRVLAASPDIQVDFDWIDATLRDRWPVDISRRLGAKHDVYLLGDLDSAAIRPQDLATMLGRIEAGAGLGMLGGFHAFEAGGWGSTPLGPALPFEEDRLARQRFEEPIRKGLHIDGRLKLVPDPQFSGVSILRLEAADADTRTAWAAMPSLEGANRLGRLRPSTKTLATTDGGATLLVAREYGEGRVLAFAADSTWRWAMQGAGDQHRRFWRQLVLWLARRDAAEADMLWVKLAQRRIAPGTPLPFDTALTKPDGEADPAASFEALVVDPRGNQRPVRVARQRDAFSGTIEGCAEPGDWRLVVRAQRPGDAEPQERVARFTVFRQDLEMANPRSNPRLMASIAEVTDGGVRPPEDLAAIFDEIAARPPTFESQERWSLALWDTWPMLLIMAACLTAEWFLRKRWGLA
ncbi:MAG: hypothetical protein FJ286_03320 [Planctomycetes bacterium]|nr:hypothetical protein [Planctomycetota bacterium]